MQHLSPGRGFNMTRSLRTERFGLVLSEQERAGLRYLAELEGLAEADVLRRMLRLAINGLPEEERQAIGWPSRSMLRPDSGKPALSASLVS
jgi:hypothetical protein